MRRLMCVFFVFAVLAFAATASAQTTVTIANKVGWDQVAPSLAIAQSYTYRYYPDVATTGIVLTGVTCTGAASPYQCEVTFPAFTPGTHTLALTAGSGGSESEKSAPLSFAFIVVPAVPTNLRIK